VYADSGCGQLVEVRCDVGSMCLGVEARVGQWDWQPCAGCRNAVGVKDGMNLLSRLIFGVVIALALCGCAHEVKESAAVAMSEVRAVEVATKAALERGWKGPFETRVWRTDVRSDSQWGDVRITESGLRKRRAVVSVASSGEVLAFDVRR
jgi:hypothetical protein